MEEKQSSKNKISIEDMHSFFSWLEDKMDSTTVTDDERRQLKTWLLTRLSEQEGDKSFLPMWQKKV